MPSLTASIRPCHGLGLRLATELLCVRQVGNGNLGQYISYMTVPNQVRGLNYNSTTRARELASVPDCQPCPAAFDPTGKVFHNCQCNAMKWRSASGVSVRGFSATAWCVQTQAMLAPPHLPPTCAHAAHVNVGAERLACRCRCSGRTCWPPRRQSLARSTCVITLILF